MVTAVMDERTEAEKAARKEVDEFSIIVLGHDRNHQGSDPSPRDELAWVRRQRKIQETRQKWFGAIVLTVLGGLIALAIDWAKKKVFGF